MHADGAPEVRHAPRPCAGRPSRLRQRGADGHHLAHAGRGGARQDRRQFHRREVVQVAVGIDQHQAAPAPRSAGTRPAAPAAGCHRPAASPGPAMPRASAGTPSWSSICAMLPGMNGCSTVATTRIASTSTRSTDAHAGLVGLVQRPGRLAVDIAVGGADHLPDLLERLVEGLPVHAGAHRPGSASAAASRPRRPRWRAPSPGSRRRSCARSATASAAPGCRDRWPVRH